MKGNEAIAEAAIRAGCRYFFGYPITPQNEIPEYMAARLPELGGCYLQAESEVAAINMVYGAAGVGARVMTSSSSPGISLKQEGISYIAASELPCVVVNMMRGGPGLGSIQASQGDYFQATKGGGHGDYHIIVYTPASIQEAINCMGNAFEAADRYRTPVMIMADGIIGQMMEAVELPEMAEYKVDPAKKPYAATGYSVNDPASKRHVINSLYIETHELTELTSRLQGRYREIEANEVRYEEYNITGAEVLVCAYGTVARICKQAINELGAEGIRAGLLRPITVWPFPKQPVAKIAEQVKGVLTVEVSAGQLVEDVRLAVNGKKPVEFLGYPGSRLPSGDEIKAQIRRIAGRKCI